MREGPSEEPHRYEGESRYNQLSPDLRNSLVALFFACSGRPDQLDLSGEDIILQVPSLRSSDWNRALPHEKRARLSGRRI